MEGNIRVKHNADRQRFSAQTARAEFLAAASGEKRRVIRATVQEVDSPPELRIVKGPTIIHEGEFKSGREENILYELPSEEKKEEKLSFEDDLQELHHYQMQFCAELGLPFDPENLRTSSYNIVHDRWHFMKLKQKGDEEGIHALSRDVDEELDTNGKERIQAEESRGIYSIKGRQLYSEHFPEKPFGQVIQFGAVYRRDVLGSPEPEREGELGEIAGWRVVNAVMTNPNTPIGTIMYSLSIGGLAEGTAYTGKFVDKLELLLNQQGERYVLRTRIAVDWDEKGYRNAAIKLDPHFFDKYDNRPLDAWYVANPKIYNGELLMERNGLSPEISEQILKDPFYLRLREAYKEQVFAEHIHWRKAAEAFNALLNGIDKLKALYTKPDSETSHKDKTWLQKVSQMSSSDFYAATAFYRKKRVATMSGWGCPDNKGIELGGGLAGGSGVSRGIELHSNSVAQFALDDDGKGSLKFNCPVCDFENKRPWKGYVKVCQNSGCPDPTKVAC